MPTIREVVEPTIAKMFELNRTSSAELRGGAFCASIERSADGEPWVQLKTGALNIFYPFDDDPLKRLNDAVVSAPHDIVCLDWEPSKYATFEFAPQPAAETSAFVEQLFVELYGFDSSTEVTAEIFDMRSGG